MTDKPPAIYLSQGGADYVQRRFENGDASVSAMLQSTRFRGDDVKCEPAKPTCDTCPSFTPIPPSDRAVCGLTIRQQPWYVPADGSGYCSEHTEAKRNG